MHHSTIDHPNFEHINPALKRYALRLTKDPGRAEDLVQDTYMSWLSRKASAKTVEKPDSYMMSVMHNLFIDTVRKAQPFARPISLDDVEPVAPDASQSLKLTCRETMAAIGKLPADYADVLIRHACHGQSYAQIAAESGIPIGTVMSRIARARAALCNALHLEDARALLED